MDQDLLVDIQSGEFKIDIKYFKPLIALMIDCQIRYKYEDVNLVRLVFNLLRIGERYDLKILI